MTHSEYPNYERHLRRRRDEHRNIQLRFDLAAFLIRMPYGTTKILVEEQVSRAWPPTGDYAPRTLENDFRAFALAADGHRPETSYTTKERIINDLDGTFDVKKDLITGDWIIHRRAHDCPKCHGRKYVESVDRPALTAVSLAETVGYEESIYKIKTEPCDCKPAKD